MMSSRSTAQAQGRREEEPEAISARYAEMIIEALSGATDPNGADVDTIASLIEERYELPSNFKGLLPSEMRRLVTEGKIVEVLNKYILEDTSAKMDAKPTTPAPHNEADNSNSSAGTTTDRIMKASMVAAMKIAEAEAMSAIAGEAAKAAELASKVATAVYQQLLQDGVIQ